MGPFDGHGDIGAPKIAGTTSYDAASQEYRLSAGGINMWSTRDEFQFVWKKLKGDFIVRTRVEFIGRASIRIASSAGSRAPGLDAGRRPTWTRSSMASASSPRFSSGARKGGITEQIVLPITAADVLQLERRGTTYIFSAARYGEPFVSAEIKDFDLGEELFVGLFLCSHNPAVMENAIFRDVPRDQAREAGLHALPRFHRQHLETLEVFTGKLQALYSSEEPFEAPNWCTMARRSSTT